MPPARQRPFTESRGDSVAKRREMVVTPKVVARAIAEAEAGLQRPTTSERKTALVEVSARDVETWSELFQPRKFSEGLHETDPKHVAKLQRRIMRKGELDPITVIKIAARWYCIDGHHRLAGYKKLKWKAPIKAEWFAGDVREAISYGLKRNEVIKLEMPQSDRFEKAWQMTVLGGWSKAETVDLTSASEGTVADMRRALKAHKSRADARGRMLAQEIPNIQDATWSRVSMAWRGLKLGEYDIEEAAAVLARRISNRLTTMLSKDPETTARALWLYDRDLCDPLWKMLGKVLQEKAEDERTGTGE